MNAAKQTINVYIRIIIVDDNGDILPKGIGLNILSNPVSIFAYQ